MMGNGSVSGVGTVVRSVAICCFSTFMSANIVYYERVVNVDIIDCKGLKIFEDCVSCFCFPFVSLVRLHDAEM